MGFLGVYTAIYPYQPQAEGELEINEGDLLYVLEKSEEDDWWKAKKKADQEEDEEPVGLVPNNYVEEAPPIGKAKALYDYTRQTDEEVSFSEDAELSVFDTSDPDWTLVGNGSDFGFAPANYIELLDEDVASSHAPTPTAAPEPAYEEPPAPALPQRPSIPEPEPEPQEEYEYESPEPAPVSAAAQGPAAAIAGILHRQHGSMSSYDNSRAIPAIPPQQTGEVYAEPEEDEGPPPALPRRPPSEPASPPMPQRTRTLEPSPPSRPEIPPTRESDGGIHESPPYSRVGGTPSSRSPSGYHIYNISEMISVMGKRKKMPTALGINIATGTIFVSPEDGAENEQQEWTADKLSHCSIEGKHVFIDLVRPSRSIDFHAGSKDTAQEIVSALGEIAGAYKAEGLREVIAAGKGGGVQKKGQILYDFMAQGDDEVTVAVGDEVIILDETKSEEWWMVRRLKNGREGVVPSSYIEITGIVEPSSSATGINAGKSTINQNRLEEERLAKEAARKSRSEDTANSRDAEVGPGMRLPERRSSLYAVDHSNIPSQRQKRGKRPERGSSGSAKSKPDPTKVRKWVDRSGTFTVEAQFIGLINGKIHLHKVNGIKIAVAIDQMSVKDIEYVEKVEGVSLDEDKPLSDIKRRSLQGPPDAKSGAGVRGPEYDWFDFFLKAGVGPHQCERYAQNFTRDSMDEAILPDITPETLRTLGLKEGDILRVMRYLDNMFNRTGSKSRLRNVSFGGEEMIGNGEDGGSGGLFTGEGGTLRNNTRKGRPTPTVQAGDVVDPKAFEQKGDSKPSAAGPTEKQETPLAGAPPPKDLPVQRGFEDDAWEVKPPKQQAASTPTASTPAAAPVPAPAEPPKQAPLAGAMADLSLLQAPLQPTSAQPQQPPRPASVPATTADPPSTIPAAQPVQAQQPQPTGANPSFFAQLPGPGQTQLQTGPPPQGFMPQVTGFQQQPQQQQQQQPQQPQQPAIMPPRQRPQPTQTFNQNSLLPPPPQRPLSAPQDASQQSRFGPPPLQPQLTGLPQLAPSGQSLGELNQQRFQLQQQQQYNQQMMQAQPTAVMPNFQNGLMPQMTGYTQPQQQFGFQPQPYLNSQPTASPFADPRPVQQFGGLQPQMTGYGNFSPPPQQPMATGINSVLPPALQPQPTGINGFGTSISPPPVPPIPQQPTAAPLQPQKTGPPPPVRFGVKPETKKLQPQPTGLRANLSQATPSNPFGF